LRRQELEKLAQRLGWTFSPGHDKSFVHRFEFLDQLRQGSNRYASCILEGVYRECPVLAFDYHYETTSRDQDSEETHHHHYNFYLVRLPLHCPELRLYPETILSRVGQALGASDIDFDSAEFSRAFVVKCGDKKFAYDLCHARMMEYLLQHRDLRLEFEGEYLAAEYSGSLDPKKIEQRLDVLVEIRNLLPEYLLQSADSRAREMEV
ncbi:MAG: hypothetical protein HYV26_09875, partial [Candidatus Hydrogenedentes bacterium]|nr:hypothetical protein [Candidatus Hydrogenedentota bacterium]